MKRKKICFVATLAETIEAFLIELSEFMVNKENYDVTFVATDSDVLLKYCGEHIHYIPVSMKRGLSWDGFVAIWKMYRIFKQEKFDIVQYSTKNAGTYASIASFLAKVPCRLYCQWGMMFAAMKGVKRALLKLDEKIICACSTVIEVESHSVMNAAIKYGVYKPEKASVIWNGSACGVQLENYDLSMRELWRNEIRVKYDIPKDALVFGWCGRITRDKGHNELFQAFREIVKGNDNVKLLMVGSYDNVETIDEGLFDWAQTCPQIIFTGSVPRAHVSQMYSAMDVFCSLSYREGFGLVVIEAAAMKLPGIVSDALGQIDTIENRKTGITVRTKNVSDVVNAMNFFIQNPETINQMGVAARMRVEQQYEQTELLRRLAIHRNELIIKTKN